MRVGYLPDMFGHVAQMPQILRAPGIDTRSSGAACPPAVDCHASCGRRSTAPSVRRGVPVGGYGNAAYMFDVPERLAAGGRGARRASASVVRERPGARDGRDRPQEPSRRCTTSSGARTRRRRRDSDRDARRVRSPALDAARAAVSSEWTGEMRSAPRANLLPSVVSARIDLKAACARAERWLERYAEPSQALYGASWPEPFWPRPGAACSRTRRTTRSAVARTTRLGAGARPLRGGGADRARPCGRGARAGTRSRRRAAPR